MSKRRRVTAGIVVAVVGFVMFELTGAWVYSRGLPWWASLALALAVFPLVPVGWHLWGERKRRRALAAATASAKPGVKAKPSALTGGDRFTLRLAAVALATLGPLLFFRAGQAWRAVRAHPGWFIPHGPPGPRTFEGDARLIGQVPADAEMVIWGRNLDGMDGGRAGAPRAARDADDAKDEAKEVLFAARPGGDVLIAVRGSDKALAKLDLADLNAQLGKQAWLPIEGPLVARRRASDLLVVVSEGWASAADDRAAGRLGGPDAIIARLDAAPGEAVVITAAAPSQPVAGLRLTAMQSWLRVDDAGIRIDADFFVADRAAATQLVDRMEQEKQELAGAVAAECRPKVEALLAGLVTVGGDTMVKASGFWKGEEVGPALMCGLGAVMKKADVK